MRLHQATLTIRPKPRARFCHDTGTFTAQIGQDTSEPKPSLDQALESLAAAISNRLLGQRQQAKYCEHIARVKEVAKERA